ncbi:MAG: heme lyase CcmF/NrfE family subunit [Actinobacteria bacterium]|nr:MAG: heme lyase CcmF/NrfE family subunit [Actinomycetota bacterium]
MIVIGKLALYFAALASLILVLAMPRYAKEKRHANALKACYQWTIGVFGAMSAAIFVLFAAFIVQDYSVEAVAQYSNADLSTAFRIAALWAGGPGSLLLWAWILSGFTAAIALSKMKRPDLLDTYALTVLHGVQLFFLALLVSAADPLKVIPGGVAQGQGLNPLLRHWAMLAHPPTLFVGYAGLTVPFAYAIAAAWSRNASATWVKLAHKWSLFAWIFLSIGIFLGSLWAYVVLGWGGYWAWDPVENASLLPWLTATAMLHSFTVYRRRNALKVWSLALTVISFLLVIVATFITRSGIVQSVHAFQPDNLMLWLFLSFMAIVAVGSGQLVASRSRLFADEEGFTELASKEFMYFLNNVIMVAAAAIVLAGTLSPTFGGPALKPETYNAIAQPIGLVYVALLAICPLMSWRKTKPERFKRYLAVPGLVTLASALPLYLYWQGLENMVRGIDPSSVAQPLGYLGLLIAVFAFTGAVQLFVAGAREKATRTGRHFVMALGGLFVRNRSQAGGYLSHAGLSIVLAGLIGSSMFVGDINEVLPGKAGSSVVVVDYSLTYQGAKTVKFPDGGTKTTATFQLLDKDTGALVSILRPASETHAGENRNEAREAAVAYTPFRDVFVIFGGQNPDGSVSVNVKVNPLIMFVWGGSIILVLGMMLAWWPKRTQEEPVAEKTRPKKKHRTLPATATEG